MINIVPGVQYLFIICSVDFSHYLMDKQKSNVIWFFEVFAVAI